MACPPIWVMLCRDELCLSWPKLRDLNKLLDDAKSKEELYV